MNFLANKVLPVTSFALLIAISVLSYSMLTQSSDQQIRKYDYANINHMKYGMFNVNIWKEKLTNIILKEVEDFEMTRANRELLKQQVSGQLDGLIDKVDTHIRKTNKNSAIGWLKQQFIDAIVDTEDLKEGIPGFSESIVNELLKNSNQKILKKAIREKIKKYMAETFSEIEQAEIDDILERTEQKSPKQATIFLEKLVRDNDKILDQKMWLLLGLSLILFLICMFNQPKLSPIFFAIAASLLFVLLLTGVLCPMIDMEAKIGDFSFNLLGNGVSFQNQTVYFQSKSVLDVFLVLMKNPALQVKIVGVLMVLFSIVFPIIKLLSSVVYYFNFTKLRNSILIQFFVLKSGKWSMADVQVVAILMAYIGFNGMISTQFDSIRKTVPDFELVTTNGTTLEIGFYIFVCYVLMALVFSNKLQKSVPALTKCDRQL